jgi:hypothetical protein
MAYHYEKDTGDIVIDGFDKGIAVSPHQGIASIRNANITTESGEVMCNYQRLQQSPTNVQFSLTANSTSVLKFSASQFTPYINQTIRLSGSTISGLSNGIYWIESISLIGGTYFINISAAYDEAHHSQTVTTWSGSSGTVTATLLGLTSMPVASTTEIYYDGTVLQTRYYVAETAGYVWVLDTAYSTSEWYLIDSTQKTSITGLLAYDGQLHVFQPQAISFKTTCILGLNPTNPSPNTPGYGTHAMNDFLNTSPNSYSALHFCLNGHSGMFYTDQNFIASIIADSTSSALNANVFSYGKYTISSNTITVNPIFAGSFPVNGQTVAFYTDDVYPSGIAQGTVYYVINASANAGTFKISTTVGGSAESISGGTGNQYFNSYDPTNGTINGSGVGGSNSTFVGTPQACTLPFFETATALAELGNNLVIGTKGNTLYVWDEGIGGTNDISPQSFIPMAETNCQYLLTVNNVVFDFRGQKGNIYVTSGSAASGVLTVPDYLAGTPGMPTTYVEPYFTFGQAFFQRGRVFFTIQDSNSNCGGVYSFVPSFFNPVSGQDSGVALRLENYNSYGSYGGLAAVLFVNQNQNANGIQYFSAWSVTGLTGTLTQATTSVLLYNGSIPLAPGDQLSIGSGIGSLTPGTYYVVQGGGPPPSQAIEISASPGGSPISGMTAGSASFTLASSIYGIDTSGTSPYINGDTAIESDIIPVGTYFSKSSYPQLEYKLSAPLATGESVQINWRSDLTSVWNSGGTVVKETTTQDGSGTIVSGYFTANTQNLQWLQLQGVLTSTATTPSFTRLTELRVKIPTDE